MKELDQVHRIDFIKNTIAGKKGLTLLYEEFYNRYFNSLKKCQVDGQIVEIGSGAGMLKKYDSTILASDILPYPTVDIALDARALPFKKESIKSVFMLNTLHHIPDIELFFRELCLCLKPGGKVYIIDQFPGIFSHFIYRYFHHEPYDRNASSWEFETTGPLSGANGALCWIVFYRDREKFKKLFPELKILGSTPHTPLRYWISGGLKKWCILPQWSFIFWQKIDELMIKINPRLASFVDIEIDKVS